ncbi:MAG: WhiB family transcriptional regulator [Actinomycetaceae bacterium]|nr:WhiB family transcriptional regulator [Actinomycetaceae bacterium]
MAVSPLKYCWTEYAKCTSGDADALFAASATQREMREICLECPVRIHCLADSLQSNMRYGLWGGLTERERRQLLRAVPDYLDWYEAITTSSDPLFVALREGRPLQFSRRNRGSAARVKAE